METFRQPNFHERKIFRVAKRAIFLLRYAKSFLLFLMQEKVSRLDLKHRDRGKLGESLSQNEFTS